MDKFVKELFTDNIKMQISSLYGLKIEDLYYVGGFENYIYGFSKDSIEYILRIAHSSHRELALVEAEIDFIFYLAKNNANVSTPVLTINNKLVEKVACLDGSYFIASAFTKAKGAAPLRKNITSKLLFNYGKTIGSFHRLTKEYIPSNNINKRNNWDQDILIKNAKDYLKEEDTIILKILDELIIEINNLDRNIDNYGLIHTDVHMGNFFVEDDELTVFDFDDLAYQYFVSDIAIALFYLVFMLPEDEKIIWADNLMTNFMQGYREANNLKLIDFLQIPLFLKLREIIIYIVLYKTVDVEENTFALAYVNKYRERIINKIAFIDLDFKKYYLNK